MQIFFILGWFSLEKPTYINTLKAYDYMKPRFCWPLHDWFNEKEGSLGLVLIIINKFSCKDIILKVKVHAI